MKRLIFSLIITLSILSLQAFGQTILLENKPSYGSIPNGAYIKDVNNVLNPYLGEWSANYDDKKITISFIKYKNSRSSLDDNIYFIDEIMARYKVEDSNGNILIDYTNELTYPTEDLRFRGMGLFNNEYAFTHDRQDRDCGLSIMYNVIKVNGDSNKLTMKLSSWQGGYFWGSNQSIEDGVCPEPQTYVDAYLLPLQTVTLIKPI